METPIEFQVEIKKILDQHNIFPVSYGLGTIRYSKIRVEVLKDEWFLYKDKKLLGSFTYKLKVK